MTELIGVLMLKLSLISSVWISTVVVSGLDFVLYGYVCVV